MTPSLLGSDWVLDHKGMPSDEAADDLAKADETATTTDLTCHHESPYPTHHHRSPAQQAPNGHSLRLERLLVG